MRSHAGQELVLKLRAGELVEVRSEAEILATLDAKGRLDALPFMPEMLTYCGKQFHVYKRADKTCDTICYTPGLRRMQNTVHLDMLRCDGSAHGGCQALCLLFWKEAWLKRVQPNATSSRYQDSVPVVPGQISADSGSMTRDLLMKATRASGEEVAAGEEVYTCQATEHQRASTFLHWWDCRQYFRDLWYGNATALQLLKGISFQMFKQTLRLGGFRAQVWAYNRLQGACGGTPYPFRSGKLTKTPTEELNLQPGDLVQVKSHDEILATVNQHNKNRGLRFDVEMAPFCGGKYRVLQRLEKFVDERTGKMNKLPGVCIIMDGVYCRSQYSNSRIACPRSIYSWWREIWLRRVE